MAAQEELSPPSALPGSDRPAGYAVFKDLLWLPLVLAVFALVAPRGGLQFYDVDEGYNLVRAALHAQWATLYSEVWCDQPPLLTVLLSKLFALAGTSLRPYRLLVALFAMLLAGSFYGVVRLRDGRAQAYLGLLLLLASTSTLRLSVSIMETVPSLALALLSLFLATLHARRPSYLLLAASGLSMALAMLTKLNVALLLPLVLFTVTRTRHAKATAVFTWALVFAVVFAGGLALYYAEGMGRIFQTHLAARSRAEFSHLRGSLVVPRMIFRDRDIAALAALGVVFSLHRKRRGILFPLAWFLLTGVLFFFHRPVWYHYYMLLALPLSWLGAAGILGLLASDTSRETGPGKHGAQRRSWISVAVMAVVVFMLAAKGRQAYTLLRDPRFQLDRQLLADLERYGDRTRWVFALDRQIYPFVARLPTPPELALTSWKRSAAGDLRVADVMKWLADYRPELVLLPQGRPYHPSFLQFIGQTYRIGYENGNTTLYLRKDLPGR